MKLIFVNRYFYPDESATSRVVTMLSQALAWKGVDIHVLTSRNQHDDPSAELAPKASERGATVHRLWTTRFGRHSLPGRAVDYFTFHLSALWHMLRLGRRGDVMVICTDPPMLCVTAALASVINRSKVVQWAFDLFPEVATDLGIVKREGLLGRTLLWLRDTAYRHSAHCVVPIQRMADVLAGRNIPAAKITTIPNFSDSRAIQPIAREACALRNEWGLADSFVVGYSGNLGRAHEFETVLQAAQKLTHREDIVFLFVGGGHKRDWVDTEARRRGLTNIIMKPLQPLERLSECLAVPDVHLVSLLPDMEPYIVPSKFYGIAAAGRPTLFVGDRNGEIARLVATGRCGNSVEIGDGEGLAQRITHLAASPALRKAMGARARILFENNFTETRAVADWQDLLARLEKPERSKQSGIAADPVRP